jgi:hypothetical protein
MKKTILILVFAMLSVAGFSQFTIGPKIGYTASKLSTNFPDIKNSVKSNFLFGAFARFGKKVYLQPELIYTTKGGVLDSNGLKQTIKLNTFDIPVMVGVKLIDLKVVSLRIHGGPVASFVMNKTITYDNLLENPIKDSSINDIDWAFNVGATLDVLLLTMDVGYQFGLNNLYNAPAGQTTYDMKSNLFYVTLGVKLF